MVTGQILNPNHELALFIQDALRFISAFIIPISQCAPQIYVSSLSFVPEQSLVAKKFCSKFPNTAVVTEGKPSHWPMVVFTAEHHKGAVNCVFSPDESTFASISASGDGIGIMSLCDSETGHCISGPFELPHDEFVCDACFSPDGRRILLEFFSYAVVLDIVTGEEQFRIEGSDFVFTHQDGRIASMHWTDKDEGASDGSEDEGGDRTQIVVKLCDASNGALSCNRLFKVDDVACTRLSPDGHFLAVDRKSESVIELWNLEDGMDPRRFSYPPGNLRSLHFSPTSDSLMAVFWANNIYLWRLDTQEMALFNHYFDGVPRVIHSPFTDYVFIIRHNTVEIWDVSATGSKLIWETNLLVTSPICGTYPSRDGHRILVGCDDGSVRMWELDLENLAMNQVDTMDTQADADMPQFIGFSHSGKVVATKSKRSHSIELLNTATGKVVSRTNIYEQEDDMDEDEDDMEIAFSPDEDQVAFWSKSHVTICDIMHPDNRVSLNPWSRKGVLIWNVAFQTCNDLVICALYDDSVVLQIWHRQDPAGFECRYSLDIKSKHPYSFLTSDGLAVIIVPMNSASATCYLWNSDIDQFHPVDFDDQVYICRDPSPVNSPDGILFACWSDKDSHIRVWDTRTGQLVSKFRTSRMDAMALSPALIEHSPRDRLIILWFKFDNTIHLLDVCTGHLYAKIWDRGRADMAFIRDGTDMAFIQDGTKLADYSPDFGLRIWDVADLMHEHSVHGYELILEDITDGWVVGQDNQRLFWIPVEHRVNLYVPSHRVVIGVPKRKATRVDLSKSRLGREWTECIDKEWLRKLKQKEDDVGNQLEKQVLSSAQVLGDVEMDR